MVDCIVITVVYVAIGIILGICAIAVTNDFEKDAYESTVMFIVCLWPFFMAILLLLGAAKLISVLFNVVYGLMIVIGMRIKKWL